jgi:type III restriction enzyme
LADEIAKLDTTAFDCPSLPRRDRDKEAEVFRYEGYDLITLEKLVEREYSIPEPQSAEEVIGYYAQRIAREVKLLGHFAALVPKIREFLQERAFGQPVDLGDPTLVRAISSGVAQYVTVMTFVKELRKLVIDELQPKLLHPGRALAQTPPFPWSRPTLNAAKCVFDRVPCDNDFEVEFARFLEKADDVVRFAKLPPRFAFAIEYVDSFGNLRYYEPDFVAVDLEGKHLLIETKGIEDINVANKDRAARLWCQNASTLTRTPWSYLKVRQLEFQNLRPSELRELAVLSSDSQELGLA